MSFHLKFPPGSPLEKIQDWHPDDLIQFAHRAASGLEKDQLARVSEVENDVAEALLEHPLIATVIEGYRDLLDLSDEAFREKLRPMVRLAMEKEVRKPKPSVPFLFLLFFCLEIADTDPVDRVLDGLLKSLRRKRYRRRRMRETPLPPPSPAEEPTVRELNAERAAWLASKGIRLATREVAAETIERAKAEVGGEEPVAAAEHAATEPAATETTETNADTAEPVAATSTKPAAGNRADQPEVSRHRVAGKGASPPTDAATAFWRSKRNPQAP